MSVNTRLQLRKGTATEWKNVNPVLLNGEMGWETDTGRIKIGRPGSSIPWNSIPYSFITLVDPTNPTELNGVTSASGVMMSGLVNSDGHITGVQIDAKLSAGSNITLTTLPDKSIEISSVSVDQETVEDIVAGMISGVSGIVTTYEDNADDPGVLIIGVTGYALTDHRHDINKINGLEDVVASNNSLSNLNDVFATGSLSGNSLYIDQTGYIGSDLEIGGNISTTGNVIVGGDLLVKGLTTTVNSTTVDIGDNIIQVNVSGANTDGGFQVYNHNEPNSGIYQFVWSSGDNGWRFIGGTANVYTSGSFTGSTLNSTVSYPTPPLSVTSSGLVENLNVDLLDGQHGSYYLDFDNATNLPSPSATGIISGHISATMNTGVLTNLGREGDNLEIVFENATINNNVITSGMIQDGQIFNRHIADNANIDVTKLANSGVTLGQTTVNLGETTLSIDGLTRISGVNASNPTYIYYAVIDGGTP